MKRLIRSNLGWIFWVILLSLLVVSPLMNSLVKAQEEPKGSNITFMPNVIPELSLTARTGRNNESFRFEWYSNTFDLELFFNATYDNVTRLFSLKDFEDDFNVTVNYVTNRNESNVQFGWIIDNVENVSDFVDSAWFKIEDSSFDYEEIELEINEFQPTNITEVPYNITYFHLPDNLILSFGDLKNKGFIIGSLNKTATSIKGFSGKRKWDLDPITYSSPVITVTGTVTNLFWELWNASTVNGWNVVWRQGSANYYINNTKILIGDGSTTTSASDVSANVLFESTVSGANNDAFEVHNSATLTLGQQDSGYATSRGVSINYNSSNIGSRLFEGHGAGTLNLYSSTFKATYTNNPDDTYYGLIGYFGANRVTVYNCIFDKVYLANMDGVNVYNLVILRGLYGLDRIAGTLQQVFLYDNVYEIHFAGASKTTQDVNIITTDTSSKIRYTGGGNDHYLVNVDWSGANDWAFYWHSAVSTSIYRQYEFDLNVTDSANSPIQNANVTVSHYGQGETQDFSILTGSNGSFATQTLTMGFYNQTGANTIYGYNPYNLTITASGYATKTFNFTLEQKTEWQIALEPSKAGFSLGFGLGFILTLMIGIVLALSGIVVVSKKRS